MTEKRVWELLARQFSGEITAAELLELESLLSAASEKAPFGELSSDLHELGLKPDEEDRQAKENSLTAIRRALRGEDGDGLSGGMREAGSTSGIPSAVSGTDTQEGGTAPLIAGSAGRLEEAGQGATTDRREKGMGRGMDEGLGTGMGQAGMNRRGLKDRMHWALGIGLVLLALPVLWEIWQPVRVTPLKEPFDKIVTKTGSRTLISLPDSSTVVLSSACQFSYNKNFGVRKREMHLTGEAFFDIHANPDMPLVVHAGNVVVRVLGTTFTMHANAGDPYVEATLLKGAIEVSLQSDPERRILLRPGERIQIRNGSDSAVAGVGAHHHPSPAVITVTRAAEALADSNYAEADWQKERMQFRKEAFRSLAKKMEQRFNVRIILADSSLQELLFTGSFEKETIGEALQALQNSAPFHYATEGNTITITRRKK